MKPVLVLPPERCVECQRPFPASEVIHLGDAPVCAECKPGAVAKLASGKPLGTFWRKRKLLVMLRPEEMVVFPARCARCNESLGVSWVDGHIADSSPGWTWAVVALPLLIVIAALTPLWLPKLVPGLRLSMARAPQMIFLLPLMLLIPLLIKMRRLPWRYALCATHAQQDKERQRFQVVLSLVLGMAFVAVMVTWRGKLDSWAIFLVPILSAVWSFFFRPVRMKGRKGAYLFFEGCGPQFLAQFPEWPGER